MSYDVIVVGGGIMGSATARALARRGHSVLLLEQFVIKHKRGSSHGASRIFRFSYPDRSYVQMAIEARSLWQELEAECGRPLLTITGGLDRGPALGDHAHALKMSGLPFEVLEGREVARRWASPRLPDDDQVLFQPDGAVIAASEAWTAFVQGAADKGADIREGARAAAVGQADGAAQVLIQDQTLTASAVVVTAGAWAAPLLESAGISLNVKPTRETVAFFDLDETPPTLVEWGHPAIYALPSGDRTLKVGEHIAGSPANPDEEGTLDDDSIARVREWVRMRFPGASPSPRYAETCFYTNTSDEHFVLERDGRIVVGSPCSGHGFKFAPWVGEKLADLAEETLG